jgi:Raf kinase inhibitor-like protein, YbhB/YbcL family
MFVDKLAISSPDIEALGRIPEKHVADGDNLPPTLKITGVPEGTVELAVIVHDPDAPLPNGFTHWTIYGLPADTTLIKPDGSPGRVGPHGMGLHAYTGAEPPFGHGQHHYYFWVYALRNHVEGAPSREEFLARCAGDIIEQARFVATYER